MDSNDFNNALRELHARGNNICCVKGSGDAIEDSGIPQEMLQERLNDEEDWGVWKFVPSKLSREDVIEVFSSFNDLNPPEVLIQYYLAECHLIEQVGYREQGAFIHPIPSDNPLGPLKHWLNAWQVLISVGYIPMFNFGDSYGPICLNINNGNIVWFDHELLHSLSEIDSQDKIIPLEQHLHNDIESFFEELLEIST